MQLFEGVKVSKKLLNQAVNDPNMTFGIEAEFFVVGAQAALRELLTKDLDTRDEGGGEFHVKKLGDMVWHDILHFFDPLQVSQHETKDKHEIMADRLLDVYQEVTHMHVQKASPDEMWETLKSKHRVHELMPMLKIFPSHRMMGIPDSQKQSILDIVRDGDVDEIRPYGKLNDMDIATAEVGYVEADYNVTDNEATRAAAYNIIAKDLSKQLGEPVLYTVDSGKAYNLSNGYQNWVLTDESDLSHAESEGDVIGCELISPKQQATEGYQNLMKVLQILQNGVLGLEIKTTYNTGLHINVGVEGKEIDALKMLILLGDDHIIQKFGRVANEHAGPAYQELVARLKAAGKGRKLFINNSRALVQATQAALRDIQIDQSDLTRLTQLMNEMKPEGKSFSVNFSKLPSGYVEFRAIGNADYEQKSADIAAAVQRMIVITYIATDPNAYRQEFLKKLYKIVADAMPKEPEKLAASVGMIGRQAGMPGGYGPPIEDEPKTPYDGENYVQYGFDSGSDTQ
jgi:hypothetical protein